MDFEALSQGYEHRQNLADPELSNIMARAFNDQVLQSSPLRGPQFQFYQGQNCNEVHPLLKVEGIDEQPFSTLGVSHGHLPPPAMQIHLSDLELGPRWMMPDAYSQLHDHNEFSAAFGGVPPLPYNPVLVPSPFSNYQYLQDSTSITPWSSSPEIPQCGPLTSIEEDEDTFNDKPYAIFIHEALMQAPGHRMMLKDIYEWFRQNTSKPQESGSNGWQNSIRHNLSMNKAFANDRDHSDAGSRKANSVWMLTDEAIKNGVQSTTRYRKTGGGKRTLGSRIPAIQRQRSGAKGGRAARRTARQRRQEQSFVTDAPFSASPDTPPYSDASEYQGLDYYDLHPAITSWPLTPMEDNRPESEQDAMQHLSLSPQSSLDTGSHYTSYADESLHMQRILLRSTRGWSPTMQVLR